MDITHILKRPIVTEKSTRLVVEENKYTFQVDKRATKPQIKQAVESLFGVHVMSVKTVNVPGQTRRAGRARKPVKLPGFKKAIVEIKKGEKIQGFEAGG